MTKKTKKNDLFAEGKLKKLWPYLVELHRTNPEVFEVDGEYLRSYVERDRWPLLADKTKCPSCGASMQQYKRYPDFFVVQLLRGMARKVSENLRAGKEFPDANQIHVTKDLDLPYVVKANNTIARQLGLIAKVRNEDGSHNQTAGWLITSRGWAFLRNEPVPSWVICFRNEIIERSTDTITMTEVFASKGEQYDADEFYEVAGLHEGVI